MAEIDTIKELKEKAEEKLSKIITQIEVIKEYYGIDKIQSALEILRDVHSDLMMDLDELKK